MSTKKRPRYRKQSGTSIAQLCEAMEKEEHNTWKKWNLPLSGTKVNIIRNADVRRKKR